MSSLIIPEHLPTVVVDVATSNLIFSDEAVLGQEDKRSGYPISIGFIVLPHTIRDYDGEHCPTSIVPQVFHLDSKSCYGIPKESTWIHYAVSKGIANTLQRCEVDWANSDEYLGPDSSPDDLRALLRLTTAKVVIPGFYEFVLPAIKKLKRVLASGGFSCNSRETLYPSYDLMMLLHAFKFAPESLKAMMKKTSSNAPATFPYYLLEFPEGRYKAGYSLASIAREIFNRQVPAISEMSLADRLRLASEVYLHLISVSREIFDV